MKKLIALFLIGVTATVVGAKTVIERVGVENFNLERNGTMLWLDMNLILGNPEVPSNKCILLTPVITNDTNSVSFPPVGIYGRRRYYYFERTGGDPMLTSSNGVAFQAKDCPDSIAYRQSVPYADWMDGARVTLMRLDRGCGSCEEFRMAGNIGKYYEKFFPTLVYIQPEVTREKRRTLEGRSYIDFPVDRTEIYPDYRRNPIELDSIRRTIDIVRNDPDARIDTIRLKGYASPESPYAHNRDLAMGRTESLKQYVNRLYKFDNVTFLTDYEPEDWAGLRRFVDGSNLDHREEILAIIDTDMDPDAKEWRIKNLYPEDYSFMLGEYYPSLRHTDYMVSYVISSYSDPETILNVMKDKPQNLSEDEFYVAASTLRPGSDDFTEVFETAVRMYPDAETANLNAANAAIRRDDFPTAQRYLEKSGDSAEADYARAALEIRKGEIESARAWLTKAIAKGLKQAEQTLEELKERSQTE